MKTPVQSDIHRCGTGCGQPVLGEAEPLVTDAGQLWKVCAESLHDQVTDATWKTWFEAVTPVDLHEDCFVLAVPSSLMKERLEGRYLGLIEHAVAAARGAPAEIRIEVRTDVWADAAGGEAERPKPDTPARVTGSDRIVEAPLYPRYQFEAFVIGSSNRFAHA